MNRIARLAEMRLDQSVDVEHSQHVVIFVLKNPGKPAIRMNRELVAVKIDGGEGDTVTATEGEPFAGDRQAPLEFLLFIERADGSRLDQQRRVDGNTAVLNIVVVNPVIHEQGEVDSDLRCRQPDTRSEFHGGKHVLNQIFHAVINVLYPSARTVKNRISGDDDVPNTHSNSLMSVA